ncbi:hypothetical protein CPB97_000892 [Podila verticillata]|nr:hypothetical protein CPB97_000892 [Podila verticillata]
MFSNKIFSLFLIAAAFMLLATVEAAPASKFALEDRTACPVCDNPPTCVGVRCPGGYCDIIECTCRAVCKKGNIP